MTTIDASSTPAPCRTPRDRNRQRIGVGGGCQRSAPGLGCRKARLRTTSVAEAYIDHDDAKTDVILAGAAAVFGGAVRGIVAQLPGYPRTGLFATILDLAWILALTGLVPLLLARYRGDRTEAFGFTRMPGRWSSRRDGLLAGAALAVAVIAAQWLIAPAGLPLGRLAAGLRTGDVTVLVVVAAQIALLTVGSLLLVTFLSVRGQAFARSPEIPLKATLRTIGLAAAAVALVTGLARSLAGFSALPVVVYVVALVVVVLLTDRFVDPRTTVHRAAVVAPTVVVALLHLFATGGLLRGDLVTALYAGGLAVGVTVVITALVHTRRVVHAPIVLLLAIHFWPSCLSPIALELARAC